MQYPRLFLTRILVGAAFLVLCQGVLAKDQWIEVRSKNFHLIGNASEKEIRTTAKRLEQFREAFRILFSKMNLTSATPTTVVVFKNDAAYKSFKPVRGDGKTDDWIAGYFQPGEDVNYITLAAGGDAGKFSTIFHEYVHFIVGANWGKSEVPAWFNEGLAQYYQTFLVEDDIKIKLGLASSGKVLLLRQNELMPLSDLFAISNRQLHSQGGRTRDVFYAQSWALVHYLQINKPETLGQFVSQLLRGVAPDKAFQDVFKMTFADMEKELRKYIAGNNFRYLELTLKNKLALDSEMQATPLPEALSNAYLGDLLFHTNRPDDAEPYLVEALRLEPEQSLANTTLGLVKMRQRKFREAQAFLEKAIAGDQKNHLALYQYAYMLSREGEDELGYIRGFDAEVAAKMRGALRRAIALKPDFGPSYDLLAFVALVTRVDVDAATDLMQKALTYQPGNQSFRMRLAELLLRSEKYAEADSIAEKIAATTDDTQLQHRASTLRTQIAYMKEDASIRKDRVGQSSLTTGSRVNEIKPFTEAELKTRQALAELRAMNASLRKTGDNEKRVLGSLKKIDCSKSPIAYTIASADGELKLTSKDFESLVLGALDMATAEVSVGCTANLSRYKAVVTYKASDRLPAELVALEFVPDRFRFLSADEMREPVEPSVGEWADPSPDSEARRQAMIAESIRSNLKVPAAGERRELGTLEKIECTNKEVLFQFNVGGQSISVRNSDPESVAIRLFVPALAGMQLGCGITPIDYPAVFVFSDRPDAKKKIAGDLISIDFVPKAFVLK